KDPCPCFGTTTEQATRPLVEVFVDEPAEVPDGTHRCSLRLQRTPDRQPEGRSPPPTAAQMCHAIESVAPNHRQLDHLRAVSFAAQTLQHLPDYSAMEGSSLFESSAHRR